MKWGGGGGGGERERRRDKNDSMVKMSVSSSAGPPGYGKQSLQWLHAWLVARLKAETLNYFPCMDRRVGSQIPHPYTVTTNT